MHVVVTQSPVATHKYRVKLPNKKTFDIGYTESPDYTDHKDPFPVVVLLVFAPLFQEDARASYSDPYDPCSLVTQ